MKIRLLLLLLISNAAFGQMNNYNYQRPLDRIDEQWHKIELPNEIFSKLNSRLTDLRIFGITDKNDTIEAPYLLNISQEELVSESSPFKILNVSSKDDYQFITLRIPSKQAINKIDLGFEQKNFDWLVNIEGSNNQNEWFDLAKDQRILSIRNDQTNYSFTELNFSKSQYEYYRLSYKSDIKPTIDYASTTLDYNKKGNSTDYPTTLSVKEDKKRKESILTIKLKEALPVHRLKLKVENEFDYYRPIRIEYVSDSATMNGRKEYIFNQLFSGTLSSLEDKNYLLESAPTHQLKVTVSNQSNQPLTFSSAQVVAYKHELIARFTEDAGYYLYYGNKYAKATNYDIKNFKNKIPKELKALTLGKEIALVSPKKKAIKQSPLFENKAWLWALMTIIIVTLGWFSIKMLKQKDAE